MPELVRFYGGTPVGWFCETPLAWVVACLRQIPSLTAAEAMQEAQRVGVGTGSLEKASATSLIRSWAQTIAGVVTAAPAAAQGPQRFAAKGAKAFKGLKVIAVPKKAKARGDV